jgi:hypothetical protein
LTMDLELTKIELKAIRKYLSKVYPGVSEQDDLWNLIKKIDTIIEGMKHVNKTKGNSRK